MFVWMYVCMCTSVFLIHIHTYVYISTHRYIDLDVDIYIYIYVDVFYIYGAVARYICIYICIRACMHARTRGYKNTCVYRWLGMYGHASVYLYDVYIHDDAYIPIIYLLCTYTHACMWVCTDRLRTQVSMRACAQADATRIDGCTCIQSPSIHLNM